MFAVSFFIFIELLKISCMGSSWFIFSTDQSVMTLPNH